LAKLWQRKGKDMEPDAEKYTVGNDYILDAELIPYDIRASKAHAKMLAAKGYLSKKELNSLLKGLDEIGTLHSQGKFVIKAEDEDCHTAIENYLVTLFGDVGKKIHTARSRNDQSMTALRLLFMDKLAQIVRDAEALQTALGEFSKNNKGVPMPGYTHMRKAMPTTVNTLVQAYQDMISDDIALIKSVLDIINKNPLGSAAGFGVPLDIDRTMTTKELGFASVQLNPIHCANSRGKYESLVAYSLFSIMQSLNKIAIDLILFSMPEFGYITLPPSMCTGSSIMPQKQNPDVLELVRANAHIVHGNLVKINGIILNLPSGYNRDFQLTKGPVLESLHITSASLRIMTKLFRKLETENQKLKAAMTPELFATMRVYDLVKKGMPFRDAYKKVASDKKSNLQF